jgi:hypothetical protein
VSRHRRSRVGLFVRRSQYLSLWRKYDELLTAYRALEGDHQSVLDDHEAMLFAAEGPVIEVPAPGRQTSWGRDAEAAEVTVEVPVITSVPPLDVDKADALVRRTGLLDGPAGSWARNPGTTD